MSQYPNLLKTDYDTYVRQWTSYCMELSEEEWYACYDIIMMKCSKPAYDEDMWYPEQYILDKLKDMPQNIKILDIGCFYGRLLYRLHLSGIEALYGIDCSKSAIELAQKMLAEKNVQITLDVCGAEHIKYLDNFFDAITCVEVLEHVKSPQEVLKEIYRILQPTGVAYISFPHKNQVWSWCHINYFSGDTTKPSDIKGCLQFFNINELFDKNKFDVDTRVIENGKVYIIKLVKK